MRSEQFSLQRYVYIDMTNSSFSLPRVALKLQVLTISRRFSRTVSFECNNGETDSNSFYSNSAKCGVLFPKNCFDQTSRRPVISRSLYQHDTRGRNDLFILFTSSKFWFKVEISDKRGLLYAESLAAGVRDANVSLPGPRVSYIRPFALRI